MAPQTITFTCSRRSSRPAFSNGTDVMFARSTNGGQSFSAPHRINDDPINHNKWHWFGTLSVAPNGRIDSVWLDTRNAANNTDSQLFYSYSTDGGVTWSPNVAVSNSFNPFDRLSEPEQDRRLHHDRFRQYRRQRRLCRHVQQRRRRLLRSRGSRRPGSAKRSLTKDPRRGGRLRCPAAPYWQRRSRMP